MPFRTFENKAGVVYDEAKTTIIFAEDMNALGDAVDALGTPPVVATASEINTGTNNTKFASPQAIADSNIAFTSDITTQNGSRINPRVGTTTSHATPTINTDNVDMYTLTAQAEAITSFTTNLSGTPVNGQKLIIRITGTAAREITWGASFVASTVALPTTTVTTEMLTVGFIYDSVSAKWVCSAVA